MRASPWRLIATGAFTHPIERWREGHSGNRRQAKKPAEQAAVRSGIWVACTTYSGDRQAEFRSEHSQTCFNMPSRSVSWPGMAPSWGLPVKTRRRAGLPHESAKASTSISKGAHGVVGASVGHEIRRAAARLPRHRSASWRLAPTDVLDPWSTLPTSVHHAQARAPSAGFYVPRLFDLEKIATVFPRRRTCLFHPGRRDVRVIVENSRVSDQQARCFPNIARRWKQSCPIQARSSGGHPRDRATDYASNRPVKTLVRLPYVLSAGERRA